jgi:hypothetical protein
MLLLLSWCGTSLVRLLSICHSQQRDLTLK